MDTVSKRFYVGNINNFGFGTWNSGVPMFKNNLRSTNINNNNNNNVPYAAPTPASSNYNNSTAFPIPKTLYSMNNNNLAQSVTIPFKKTMDPNEKTLASNFNNNGYETRRNFNPENLKIQVLEEKIRNIEKKNDDDSNKFQQMILNSLNNNKNNNDNNNNVQNLIKNLQGNDIDEEYDLKRGKRREQIKYELEQAREKLKHSSSSSDYEEEEEEEEEELDENGEPKLKNFNDYSSMASKTTKNIKSKRKSIKNNNDNNNNNNNNINNQNQKDNNVIFVNKEIPNNPLLKQKTPAQEEADEFINSIPNHIALQLQSENFKVRANLAYIKNSFRDIRNDIQNKLDQLEMRQKLNFESIRYALEAGGNKKLQMSLKKIVDGEDVDIDKVEEEIPQFLENLPDIIDQRIIDIDQKRKIEDEKERKEEELMMQDEKNLILPPIGRINNIYNLHANEYNNNMVGNKNNFMYDSTPNNNNQYNNNNINYLKSNLQPQNLQNNEGNFNNNFNNNNFNNNNFNNNNNNNNNFI